jgi:hypothetical protein
MIDASFPEPKHTTVKNEVRRLGRMRVKEKGQRLKAKDEREKLKFK